MRKYGKWILTFGILAATPGATMADGILNNFLPKKPAPSQTTKPAAAKSQNQLTAERIADALRVARLQGTDVQIEFKGGTATLKGKVANAAQQRMASNVVNAVAGVKKVDNQLALVQAAAATIQQVAATATKPAGPTNQQIAQSIASSLGSAGLNGYDVQIQVKDGVATLLGFVGSPQQVQKAAHIARQTAGIQQVANQLKVTPATPQNQAPQMPAMQQQPQAAMMAQAAAMQQAAMMRQASAQGAPPVAPAAYRTAAANPGAMMAAPPAYQQGPAGVSPVSYDSPHVPNYAWPSYAAYPNYAAVTYPTQYSASAWPYIGPFYPYPQVPLGWRKAQLEWDDGHWHLNFNPRTERWWWFLNPENWD